LGLTPPQQLKGFDMKALLAALMGACLLVTTFGEAEARREKPTDDAHNAWWGSAISAAAASERPARRSSRRDGSAEGRSESRAERSSERNSGGVGPRPSQWCGWWMRTQRGGGPEFNLAWNWTKYGSAGSPQVGAVVVWRHHVGEIVGQGSNGQWLVRSGNDGGQVRTRARSIAGAVIRV
jgi:hypothetical protein